MDRYIDQAIQEARKSAMENKHGCVIYATKGSRRGEILAKSHNHWFNSRLLSKAEQRKCFEKGARENKLFLPR
jgi:hypothetical protein